MLQRAKNKYNCLCNGETGTDTGSAGNMCNTFPPSATWMGEGGRPASEIEKNQFVAGDHLFAAG